MTLQILKHQLKRGSSLLVSDLSLELRLGNRLLVSGRNGCGKSSFLEDLYLSTQTPSKTILWNFNSLNLFRMTQNLPFDFYSPDTSADYLQKTLEVYGLNHNKMKDQLEIQEALQMVHLKNKWLSELSGGEKQKLKFAQCLLLKPQVLLLDEPFSAVDPSTKFQLYRILDLLLTHTLQIIVVHDLLDIKRLNSPVLVFENQQALLFDPGAWFRKVDSLLHAEPCHHEVHL
jgi:ABC-type Mn2+/Zn2+ transport system ATPase subunit